MANTYKVEASKVSVGGRETTMLKVGFGDPAQNDQIVRDVESRMIELETESFAGELVLVNGPASLPVAVVLSHHLIHRFGAIGVFDPKMSAYVVSAAHGGDRKIGDLIPAADMK